MYNFGIMEKCVYLQTSILKKGDDKIENEK